MDSHHPFGGLGANLAFHVPKAIAHRHAVDWWRNFRAIFICIASDWPGRNWLRVGAWVWNACDGMAVLGFRGGGRILPNLRHHVRRGRETLVVRM